jgi:hypothetical protein
MRSVTWVVAASGAAEDRDAGVYAERREPRILGPAAVITPLRAAGLAGLLFAPAAPAQSAFPQNKLEFGNWWIAPREDAFPNFRTAGGNVQGDALFKVVPGELLERAGDHQFSGYVLGVSVDDAFRGPFPVGATLPAMQLYRTKQQALAGKTYDVPDLAQPVGPLYDRVFVGLQSDGAWVVEVRFAPTAANPPFRQTLPVPGLVNGQRAGLALHVLAPPGQRSDPTRPNLTMLATHEERHLAPGRDSYSGSFDAAAQAFAMYGQTGQPSATGELFAAPRFATPTLQLAGSSAGGVRNDPLNFETHLGPGAYATDLASRAQQGFFGLFVQAEQFHAASGPPTHRVFPFLVATSAGGPDQDLPLGGATLRVNAAELGTAGLLVGAGLHGPLARYVAASGAGFDEDQLGAYASPRVPFASDPALIGLAVWLQGVVTDVALAPVATTNVVRWTLR